MNSDHVQVIREALRRLRVNVEMSDLDKGHEARELARIDAAIAALDEGVWEPLPDGAYHTDGPELVKVNDARLSIVRHNGNAYVDLQQGYALCRKRPPAQAMGDKQ